MGAHLFRILRKAFSETKCNKLFRKYGISMRATGPDHVKKYKVDVVVERMYPAEGNWEEARRDIMWVEYKAAIHDRLSEWKDLLLET